MSGHQHELYIPIHLSNPHPHPHFLLSPFPPRASQPDLHHNHHHHQSFLQNMLGPLPRTYVLQRISKASANVRSSEISLQNTSPPQTLQKKKKKSYLYIALRDICPRCGAIGGGPMHIHISMGTGGGEIM